PRSLRRQRRLVAFSGRLPAFGAGAGTRMFPGPSETQMSRELRHIHALLEVARRGSFTRAAAELRVSQPALTVQVRQLEAQLGVSLFDRNKRRVALTQAGRDLVAPLERVIFDFESVIANTRDFVEHRRGIVAVSALPSIAAGLLPRAMKQLA